MSFESRLRKLEQLYGDIAERVGTEALQASYLQVNPNGTIVPLLTTGSVAGGDLLGTYPNPRLRWNVKSFGAQGTGVVNDSPGIQAALDNVGYALLDPGSSYRLDDGLVVDDYNSVAIVGLGGGPSSGSQRPLLEWPNNSGNMISALSSQGFTIRNVGMMYSHAAYADDLILFGHSGSGLDCQHTTIEDCELRGVGGAVNNARSLLNLDSCIIGSVNRCQFRHAGYGVIGNDGLNTVDMELNRCDFIECENNAILNPGQAWTLKSCVFEPKANGSASGIATDLVAYSYGTNIIGCWFGDVSFGDGRWITLKTLGGSVQGCFFGDPGGVGVHIALEVCEGLLIAGNRFEAGNAGVYVPTASSYGVMMTANDFQGVTNPVSGAANLHQSSALANVNLANATYV